MSKETTNAVWGWQDSAGRPSSTKAMFLKTLTNAQIQTAMAAGSVLIAGVSGSALAEASATFPMTITPSAFTAGDPTGTAMDKVVWKWRDSDGNEFEFDTPSPLPAQMVAGTIKIDVAIPAVANFITWVYANLKSPYGQAVVALVKAARDWRGRKAKNT